MKGLRMDSREIDSGAERSMGRNKGALPLLEPVAAQIIDSSFRVHSVLGPGLLESVYETCLAHELNSRGYTVTRQVPMPVVYAGLQMDVGFRLDLVVENSIIVELKATDRMSSVHLAQILTYLKLTDMRLGFLINFNVSRIKDGIRRVIL